MTIKGLDLPLIFTILCRGANIPIWTEPRTLGWYYWLWLPLQLSLILMCRYCMWLVFLHLKQLPWQQNFSSSWPTVSAVTFYGYLFSVVAIGDAFRCHWWSVMLPLAVLETVALPVILFILYHQPSFGLISLKYHQDFITDWYCSTFNDTK